MAGCTSGEACWSRRVTPTSTWRPGIPGCALEPGGATMARGQREKLSRKPYARLPAERHQPALVPPMVRRWYWAAPADRAVQGQSAEGSRPVAGSQPDRAARSPHPADARCGDRLARWSTASSARPRNGRATARIGCRRRWPAGRGPGPGIGDGPVAIPAGRARQGCEPSRPVRRGRRTDPRGWRAQRPDRHGFRLVKGRVLLRGRMSCWLDGDTGAVDCRSALHPARSIPIASSRRSAVCSMPTGPTSSCWCCERRTATFLRATATPLLKDSVW